MSLLIDFKICRRTTTDQSVLRTCLVLLQRLYEEISERKPQTKDSIGSGYMILYYTKYINFYYYSIIKYGWTLWSLSVFGILDMTESMRI